MSSLHYIHELRENSFQFSEKNDKNSENNKKTSGKYTVNSKNNDDNNNRSDVQDLMARMRKIEGDKNRQRVRYINQG